MNLWKAIQAQVSGRKSYTLGGLMIAVGVITLSGYGQVLPADLVPTDPIGLVTQGLLLVFLRQGIAKTTNGITPTNPGDRLKAQHAKEGK